MMLRLVEQPGVSAVLEEVVDLRASVVEVKEAPISVTAAALSRAEESTVSGARVASEVKS